MSAVVKKQAKRNGDIKINAQNIGFNGRAKAYRGLKISKSLNQAAAWHLRRGADGRPLDMSPVKETVLALMMLWLRATAARKTSYDKAKEEHVEDKEEREGCSGSHF
ncbi:hypothetical protein Ancab_032474 [Ancistrocladus abbreviatus]